MYIYVEKDNMTWMHAESMVCEGGMLTYAMRMLTYAMRMLTCACGEHGVRGGYADV